MFSFTYIFIYVSILYIFVLLVIFILSSLALNICVHVLAWQNVLPGEHPLLLPVSRETISRHCPNLQINLLKSFDLVILTS